MRGRDYKRTPQRNAHTRRLLPAWFWMLVGFIPPAIVAILIYLDKIDVRRVDPYTGSGRLQAGTDPVPGRGRVKVSAGKNKAKQKSGVLVSRKLDTEIKFIYDRELKKDVVPSTDFSARGKKPAAEKRVRPDRTVRGAGKKSGKNTHAATDRRRKPAVPDKRKRPRFSRSYLQAGAFNHLSQAQTHKKRLAKLGVHASILTVRNKGGRLYRVRLGPFTDAETYKKNLRILKKNNIKAFRTNK